LSVDIIVTLVIQLDNTPLFANGQPASMVSEHRINPTMLKILIVDDDPSLALLFRLLFERHGCDVVSCSSAESAIQLAEQFKPQALLCDLHVEAESGIHVANVIRALCPACRIVLMSGADVHQFESLVDPSMQVLQKPIGAREVLEAFGIVERKRAVNE
jgi:CheY-like chemotaxis protein